MDELQAIIRLFVFQNEKASDRFKHFLLAAVGLPSEVASAIMTSDGFILIRRTDEIGHNDLTGWSEEALNKNLNSFADVYEIEGAHRALLFHKCCQLFDYAPSGRRPILTPR